MLLHTGFVKHIAVILALTFSGQIAAEQVKFEKNRVNDNYVFDYKWTDHKETERQMNFAIPVKSINNAHRHFKALRPSLLQMYSQRQLNLAVAKLDRRKGKVKIQKRPNGLEFNISSTDNQWIEEQSQNLSKIYKQSLSDYLKKSYYVEFPGFHNVSSSTVSYKPDHLRFAREDGKLLQPIANFIKTKYPRATARQVARFLLGWLQSIPYDKIESRSTSNGSGFLPPIKVVAQNIGDCDSKVTLMASILKQIFPRLRIAIVYIPQHALIGLNVSHLQEDYVLKHDGLDFVLAEPVGPATIPFAEIDDKSKRYIESGSYLLEVLK